MKKLFCLILSISIAFCFLCMPSFSASSMTLKNETYPTEILKGSTFSAYGIITSDSDIQRVEIAVLDSAGNKAFGYVGNPYTTTYDIHNVDYLLTFSQLGIGTYTYKITANNEQSKNVVLLSKQFKVVSTLTPSAIKLSGETYPTSYIQGNTFSIYGTVSSDYLLSDVTCAVYSSGGAVQFSKSANPGTYSYSLHNLDSYMTFSKLTAGTYTYKVTASDAKTKNVVLLSKSFTVTTQSGVSDIKIESANYPGSIDQGKTFSIYGQVSSSNLLTDVTCSVYSSNGTLQFTKSVAPNANTYSIHDMDAYMTFSKLSVGSYTYKITASDTKTKNVVLLNKTFAVVSVSPLYSVRISSANYPSTITAGETFSVRGVIYSDYVITNVTVGVYNTDGTTKFKYSGNPNSREFNINNVDSLMTFSKLTKGSYVYIITASDAQSKNVVLVQKNFSVIEAGSAESDLRRVNWDVIDLSYWNEIDSWDEIARSVDGVILRIGYRSTGGHVIGSDSTFLENYREATARGLHVGCYFFSAALNEAEAIEEAEYIMNIVKTYDIKFDMPVYLDLETEDQVDLSQSECTRIARAYCDIMQANGFYPGIYCNKYFARDELYASELNDVTMWIAQYGSQCTYDGPYGIWQYSENGMVSGITGNVDLNYCYYDFPAYIKSNGLNKLSQTPVVIKPTYDIAVKNGIKVDTANKIISRVSPKLTTSAFQNTYVTKSSNVFLSFGNTVSGYLATGSTVAFKTTEKTLATYTVSVLGDADGNSLVNSADALIALESAIGRKTISGVKKLGADMNGDGTINSADALAILQYAVTHG